MASEGAALTVGTRIRHRRHPELTGRVGAYEWASPGVLSGIPYNIDWDDNGRACDVLGWFFVYGSDSSVEPLADTAPRSGASKAAAGSPDRPPPESQPEMAAHSPINTVAEARAVLTRASDAVAITADRLTAEGYRSLADRHRCLVEELSACAAALADGEEEE